MISLLNNQKIINFSSHFCEVFLKNFQKKNFQKKNFQKKNFQKKNKNEKKISEKK